MGNDLLNDDRQIVPAEHAPRKDAMQDPFPDTEKLAIWERDNMDAWMTCEYPIEVKQ